MGPSKLPYIVIKFDHPKNDPQTYAPKSPKFQQLERKTHNFSFQKKKTNSLAKNKKNCSPHHQKKNNTNSQETWIQHPPPLNLPQKEIPGCVHPPPSLPGKRITQGTVNSTCRWSELGSTLALLQQSTCLDAFRPMREVALGTKKTRPTKKKKN